MSIVRQQQRESYNSGKEIVKYDVMIGLNYSQIIFPVIDYSVSVFAIDFFIIVLRLVYLWKTHSLLCCEPTSSKR